ncbi:diguanylate cyclase [bacterium]|nr:diguanylate cyclase [bacterium]
MSNQNFDTNSPISSSQHLPIAQQLGSQSYLSQIQDKRHELLDGAVENETPEVQKRFGNHSQPEEVVSQRENKMDAFFRQAEEEEREKKHEKLAGEQVQDSAPVQPEASIETSDDVQNDATPVVEIPALAAPTTDSVQDNSQTPSTSDQALQPESTATVSEPSESPFSVSSFSSSFGNPAFGQTAEAGQSEQSPTEVPQVEAPVVAPVQMDASAGKDLQSAAESDSPIGEASGDSDQNTPVTSDPQNTQPTEEESRKLTGAAALSAGMAAAGIGAWAGGMGSEQANQNSEPRKTSAERTGIDSNSMDDAADQLRQQMAMEEQEVQSRGSLATYELSNNAPQFESTVVDAFQSDISQSNSEVDPLQNTGQQLADEKQAVEVEVSEPEVVEAPVNAAPVDEIQVNEPHLNAVEANEASQSAEVLTQDSDNSYASEPSELNEPSSIADSQSPSSDNSDESVGESNLDSSPPPKELSSAADIVEEVQVRQPDPEVENARLAAEQKAQQIKAERAKMLAEHAPVHARPYGAAAKQDGPSDSQDSQRQVAVESAFQYPQPEEDGQSDMPASPKVRTEVKSQLIADIVNADGTTQRRPFPLDLFNRHLLRNLRSGVVFVDHHRRVQLWSKGAESMTGIISEAVIDRPLYPQTFNLRFDDGNAVTLEQCPITQCLETMQNVAGDYRLLNSASQEVKVGITISPVIDENRYVNGAIIIFDDHSAEIDLQRQLKDLYEFSVLDPLTQVANRAEFERVLEEYVRAFNQSDSFNCSIIICDLDYFKSINDKFGHTVGDQALVGFAEMLKKYVRSQDLVARYGGEEFVILCADCNTDSALQRAEKIRMALFKTPQTMLDGKSISASFGVSELRQGDTAMEFFVRADTALLKAKEMGRNRVVIADQREASRNVSTIGDDSITGLQWRQQRREHTALVCEEFQTNTPVPVLVEKLRGFIIEKDAWLQRVDQEFLSMEVDFEDPKDYSRKGSFTLNIEFKEAEDLSKAKGRRLTYIRISIFPGRRKKWFSTNHTDVVKYLLGDLRSYLMINDEASHITIDMATENVRG